MFRRRLSPTLSSTKTRDPAVQHCPWLKNRPLCVAVTAFSTERNRKIVIKWVLKNIKLGSFSLGNLNLHKIIIEIEEELKYK